MSEAGDAPSETALVPAPTEEDQQIVACNDQVGKLQTILNPLKKDLGSKYNDKLESHMATTMQSIMGKLDAGKLNLPA